MLHITGRIDARIGHERDKSIIRMRTYLNADREKYTFKIYIILKAEGLQNLYKIRQETMCFHDVGLAW